MKNTILLISVVGSLLLSQPGQAESLVVCHIGGPGSTAQAKPVLAKFLSYFDKLLGQTAGTTHGEYHTTPEACAAYIAAKKPRLLVLDLETYLAHHRSLNLRPLATIGTSTDERYYLLARKGAVKNLAQSRGKVLITPIQHPLAFLERVIFAKKISIKNHFGRIITVKRPLQALRNLARAQVDLALVDKITYKHLGELDLPVKVEPIFSSRPLPRLIFALAQGRMVKETTTQGADTPPRGEANTLLIRKLRAVLGQMCSSQGAELCRAFLVSAFTPVAPDVFRKLERAYP